MTQHQYESLSAPFRTPFRSKAIIFLSKALTSIGYFTYPLLLLLLLLSNDSRLFFAIAIPAIGFLLLSFVRSKINRKRPYETLAIDPIIVKNTSGNSMPSRHTFSMFVIAMTWLWIFPVIGIFLLCCGAFIAVIRVIGGVHYPSDVIVAAACGILWCLLAYYIAAPIFLL